MQTNQASTIRCTWEKEISTGVTGDPGTETADTAFTLSSALKEATLHHKTCV